jgi:hypothetical protein
LDAVFFLGAGIWKKLIWAILGLGSLSVLLYNATILGNFSAQVE